MDAIPVLLPVGAMTAAVLAALAGLWRPAAARAIAIAATAGAVVLAAVGLVRAVDDGPIRHQLGGWGPPIGIEYVLDPLAGYVALLVATIGFLVVLFPVRAGFAGAPERGVPLYALTLLLLTGLFGVTMSGDLFHLFVFLEVYAIASYGLIALGGPTAAFASFRYLVFGTIGTGLYLLGVGFVYFSIGSLAMSDLADELPALSESVTLAAAVVFIVIGLGIKMALFPLHVWLPDAHSHAPPAVAALLAAIQVKVAAYALVRILFDVFSVDGVTGDIPVLELLTWFGAAGVIAGSVMAIRQTNVKRMLAHSTVAQLGYIGIGIGLATPLALVGALLHVVNHAFMKSCLFFVAGAVIDRTGVKQLPRWQGLGRRMPWAMAAFAIAALSMVGVPPTAGFFSKWYLVLGTIDAGQWVLAGVIVASSLLTLAYFLRVLERVFMQAPDDPAIDAAREASPGALVPIGILAAGVIVLGFANVALVDHVLDPVAERLVGDAQ